MAVINGESEGCVVQGDCQELLAPVPVGAIDLVFGSPPYEDCRTYGIDFDLSGEAWVAWMVGVTRDALPGCKGLVAWVVCGKVRNYEYSATPEMLTADLKRAGICLRRPPAFHRVGIAGSGGPDWLRNDYEPIVCATNGGPLPWADNTACGHPPKWAPRGEMSHRLSDGARVNQWGHSYDSGATSIDDGTYVRGNGARPSHREHTKRMSDGSMQQQQYSAPAIANPGNVIHCKVGGGQMGSPLAHKNEAPFPEELAEFFVRSFCPPGGIVCDPFSGSGTTAAVAKRTGRRWIGIDVRQSQVELAENRLRDTERPLFT